MRFLRKHRTILSAAAVFACCLVIFVVFWQLDVRGAGQKSRSAYLNDFQDTVTQPVTTGIAQTFICDTPFHALGLLPSLEGAALPGTLTLSIYDDEKNFLASAEGKAAETVSGVYAVFGFPHAVESPNGVYHLLFEAEMRGGDEYALIKSFTAPRAGHWLKMESPPRVPCAFWPRWMPLAALPPNFIWHLPFLPAPLFVLFFACPCAKPFPHLPCLCAVRPPLACFIVFCCPLTPPRQRPATSINPLTFPPTCWGKYRQSPRQTPSSAAPVTMT